MLEYEALEASRPQQLRCVGRACDTNGTPILTSSELYGIISFLYLTRAEVGLAVENKILPLSCLSTIAIGDTRPTRLPKGPSTRQGSLRAPLQPTGVVPLGWPHQLPRGRTHKPWIGPVKRAGQGAQAPQGSITRMLQIGVLAPQYMLSTIRARASCQWLGNVLYASLCSNLRAFRELIVLSGLDGEPQAPQPSQCCWRRELICICRYSQQTGA
jgi:hypothetical protein